MQKEQAVLAMGIIVDSVLDVSTIQEEEIEDSPAMSGALDLDFILGIAKKEGSVKILLDIDAALQTHTVSV
jgi:purine-binding chemotaxis protein CheW